jgi:hypothetical protein
MAARVRGFAEGLQESDEIEIKYGGRPRNESLVALLNKCADLLIETWNEYAKDAGYGDMIGDPSEKAK